MDGIDGKTGKARYIQSMFTDLSESYDVASTTIAFNKDREWRDFAASLVDGCGEKVLDLCCGTGELSIRLLQKGAGRVFAFDFCRAMVREGKEKYGLKGVNFGVGDAEKLPFPDETFTCVSVAFALRNVSNIKKTLLEMKRVLKKDGRIIILDLGKPRSALIRKSYYCYFYYIAPLLGSFFAKNGGRAYTYLPHSLKNYPAQEGIKKLMEEIDFKDIQVYDLTKGIVSVHVGNK